MANAPFLTTDEIAVFRCDNEADNSAFIARGPIKRFGDAFEQAFRGYDYDSCWQVLVIDTVAGNSRDVTDEIKTEFFDTTWETWREAVRKDQYIYPAFMRNMREVIAL